jgi:hypothetical protein
MKMPSFQSWIFSVGVLALWLGGSSTVVAQQSTGSSDPSPSASITVENLPDSPGTIWARLQEPAQQSDPTPSASSPPQQNSAPAQQDQTEPKMQRPVGTAAAEAPKVSGITAAQPAGIAIAPAKQRRVRILVLKVGAIIGAGAAIGTIVALSAATPSKPPGAH